METNPYKIEEQLWTPPLVYDADLAATFDRSSYALTKGEDGVSPEEAEKSLFDGVKDFFTNAIATLGKIAGGAVSAGVGVFAAFADGIRSLAEGIGKMIGGIFKPTEQIEAPTVWSPIKTNLEGALKPYLDTVEESSERIDELLATQEELRLSMAPLQDEARQAVKRAEEASGSLESAVADYKELSAKASEQADQILRIEGQTKQAVESVRQATEDLALFKQTTQAVTEELRTTAEEGLNEAKASREEIESLNLKVDEKLSGLGDDIMQDINEARTNAASALAGLDKYSQDLSDTITDLDRLQNEAILKTEAVGDTNANAITILNEAWQFQRDINEKQDTWNRGADQAFEALEQFAIQSAELDRIQNEMLTKNEKIADSNKSAIEGLIEGMQAYEALMAQDEEWRATQEDVNQQLQASQDALSEAIAKQQEYIVRMMFHPDGKTVEDEYLLAESDGSLRMKGKWGGYIIVSYNTLLKSTDPGTSTSYHYYKSKYDRFDVTGAPQIAEKDSERSKDAMLYYWVYQGTPRVQELSRPLQYITGDTYRKDLWTTVFSASIPEIVGSGTLSWRAHLTSADRSCTYSFRVLINGEVVMSRSWSNAGPLFSAGDPTATLSYFSSFTIPEGVGPSRVEIQTSFTPGWSKGASQAQASDCSITLRYIEVLGYSKPVEVMPATPGYYDAQNWLRATLPKYGLNYQTVTELPFEIDSRNVTNMYRMFDGCSSLTSVPQMDTSQVTDMGAMFRDCSSLTSVPQMDTSQVTRTYAMFSGCKALTFVPDMATSNVTSAGFMFNGCSRLNDGNVRLIGKHPNVTTDSMITNSGLTHEPFVTLESA